MKCCLSKMSPPRFSSIKLFVIFVATLIITVAFHIVWFRHLFLTRGIVVELSSTQRHASLCTEGVLQKTSFEPSPNDGYWAIRPNGGCRLHRYTQKDVVYCLDSNEDSKRLHFFFVGDSRIRQHYTNFLKLIPDLDRPRQAAYEDSIIKSLHLDTSLRVPLLNNLLASYRWRTVLDDELVEEFSSYLEISSSESSSKTNSSIPHFILIGISAHHMTLDHNNDHRSFERPLGKLLKILEQFSRLYGTRIIWMNQYPTVDVFAKTGTHSALITAEKLEHYNTIVRSALKDRSFIQLWDSANPIVEEYVRGCSVHFNRGNMEHRLKNWMVCADFIHTGFGALSQATQLLYNDICNSKLNVAHDVS